MEKEKDLIKTNIYLEKEVYEFLKIHCKLNNKKLNQEVPKIFNFGWFYYRQLKDINI